MELKRKDQMQAKLLAQSRKRKDSLVTTEPDKSKEYIKPCNKCGGTDRYAPRPHNKQGNCKRCARRQANFYYKQKLAKSHTN